MGAVTLGARFVSLCQLSVHSRSARLSKGLLTGNIASSIGRANDYKMLSVLDNFF